MPEDCKALVFDKQITKVFLITFYSNECLSIKGAEHLRVPSSGLVDIMFDVVKTVRPVVENFGDDERAFPSGGELVWLLLIHSEDQVSFLGGSTLHVSGMESMQVLLIDSRSDHGHFSFFF